MNKTPNGKTFRSNPHIMAAMIHPYIDGARVQLRRYAEAQSYCKHDPVGGVNQCMYEASSLFEHLSSIAWYLRLTGIDIPDSKLFTTIRTHLRHDVREEFDQSSPRKEDRANLLKLNPKLQMDVGFNDRSISVGGTSVTTLQISNFINTADGLRAGLMNGATIKSEADRS